MSMTALFLFYLLSLWACVAAGTEGTVVVSSGNTLKVHSEPSTSAAKPDAASAPSCPISDVLLGMVVFIFGPVPWHGLQAL